jgi:hypothetical protein
MSVQNKLSMVRKKINKASYDYEVAKATIKQEYKAVKEAKQQIKNTVKAQQLVQQVAEQVQQKAHKRIASVVTRCLRAVFGVNAYAFRLVFRRSRGRTEAQLAFERKGARLAPTAAAGGGVVDVAAFALRLACLLLTRPPVRRVVILDEPFKFVSAEYRDGVRELLEALAKELDVQFVIVTHIEELQCGTVIRL